MIERVTPRNFGLSGVFALEVQGSQRLWRYFHEAYCITVVREGEGSWRCRGRTAPTHSGLLMLMDPGEVHVTTSVRKPADFTALFLDPTLVEEICRHLQCRQVNFMNLVCGNAQLHAAFCNWLETSADQLPEERFEQLSLIVGCLFQNQGLNKYCRTPVAKTPVRRAASLIQELYHAEPWKCVDIKRVAADVGLAYHWLVHSFTREFGIPPYQYAKTLRLAYARQLIAKGPTASVGTMSELAAVTGFADGSHFNRDFKKQYGVTPLKLAQCVRPGWANKARPAETRYDTACSPVTILDTSLVP